MNRKMLIKTLVALAIIAVVLPPLIMGGTLLAILLAAVAVMSAYEIAMVCDQKPHYILTAMCTAAMAGMCLVKTDLFPGAAALWLTVLFAAELFSEKLHVDQVVYTFTLTVLLALALRCVLGIYSQSGAFLILLYIALNAFVCDTAAYFVGSFFGKHKMIPRVSPNKTWEGAAGGYVIAAAVSMVYGLLVLKQLPAELIIAGSLILPVVSQIGDLSFSSVKRRFDIKDFSNLLPGHGGVLDRIDSLVFCLVVFSFLMALWGIA